MEPCRKPADPARLSTLHSNLISNAIKFSPGGRLTVRPSWKKADDTTPQETEITLYSGETDVYVRSGDLQVEVADTGSGMTNEQLKRLFTEGVQFNGSCYFPRVSVHSPMPLLLSLTLFSLSRRFC